jgi:hypothetical protein
MLLLGGLQTVMGPLAGAAVLHTLKDQIMPLTELWRLVSERHHPDGSARSRAASSVRSRVWRERLSGGAPTPDEHRDEPSSRSGDSANPLAALWRQATSALVVERGELLALIVRTAREDDHLQTWSAANSQLSRRGDPRPESPSRTWRRARDFGAGSGALSRLPRRSCP